MIDRFDCLRAPRARTIAAALAAGLAGTAADAAPDLARGEYLVNGPMACGNCHSPFGPQGPEPGKELSGRVVMEEPQMLAVAPNITPGSRVADWSDAELIRAIREGIRPDGTVIGPPMPIGLYRGIGDEDIAAVVGYLRSVPAVENETPPSRYDFPLPPAYGPPLETVSAPERAVSAEYGAYIAGPLAHCIECHSPMGPQGPDFERLGAGGFVFEGPWGKVVAPNITSHEDGLAGYSDAEIKQMIHGQRPDGEAMMPPMPYWAFARMTEEDLDALVMYLRTIPPLPDAG